MKKSFYQQKKDYFIYDCFIYTRLMVTTKQKSIAKPQIITKGKTEQTIIENQPKEVNRNTKEKMEIQNNQKTKDKMAVATPHIYQVITLNVNGLNLSTKRHRVAIWIKEDLAPKTNIDSKQRGGQ